MTFVGVKIPLRKRFGQRVKEFRLASGASQEAFADRSGFARSYMSRIERGTANPSLDAVEALADALGVKVVTLFLEDETPDAGSSSTSVPYASDGSCFNPSLRRPKSGTYSVGEKSSLVKFDSFEAALAYLKSMKTAKWWRPNENGNWGLVSAMRWDAMPKKYSVR